MLTIIFLALGLFLIGIAHFVPERWKTFMCVGTCILAGVVLVLAFFGPGAALR